MNACRCSAGPATRQTSMAHKKLPKAPIFPDLPELLGNLGSMSYLGLEQQCICAADRAEPEGLVRAGAGYRDGG